MRAQGDDEPARRRDGRAVRAGAQTEIGGNDRYIALCRRHFMERLRAAEERQLQLSLATATRRGALNRRSACLC
jgi:hypothetical protein